MFGLGFQELVVVLVIALLFFGGNKLPEVGSALGKAIREFKHAAAEPDSLEAKALEPSGLQPRHPRRIEIGKCAPSPTPHPLHPHPTLLALPHSIVPHMPHEYVIPRHQCRKPCARFWSADGNAAQDTCAHQRLMLQ